MVGGGQRLPLLPRPGPRTREVVHALGPRAGARLELEAVLADVAEVLDADDRACHVARPAGDARDEGVAAAQTLELAARLGRHRGVLGSRDDRSQHAVHVEEERRQVGLGGEESERIHPA